MTCRKNHWLYAWLRRFYRVPRVKNPERRPRSYAPRLEHLEVRLAPTANSLLDQQLVESYGRLPLSFEPNIGQTDSQVQFLSRGSGYTLFLNASEAVLSLEKPSAGPKSLDAAQLTEASTTMPASPDVLRMQLLGANATADASGLDRQEGKSNYLIGNDPNQWHTDIANYGQVQYRDVYAGVDLVYYGIAQRQLEYDFQVAPGADPGQIRLQFTGQQGAELDAAGNLVLHTTGGDVVQHAPVAYQELNGARQSVAAQYVLAANGQVGFSVGRYDERLPLTIDPVLVYSTYLGGNADDAGYAIALDNSGNAYVTGYTYSTNFPITGGAWQTTFASFGGGPYHAFVTKLNAEGTARVYSTYLGGGVADIGNAIAVDGSGNAYVTGLTYSTNFPTTTADVQASFGGGAYDTFVTKLNATGSGLLYSSYLGGNNYDVGNGIAVDGSGNAYITGYTFSSDFPTTAGAFQTSLRGPADTFVTKFNVTGSSLLYSTYVGGDNSEPGMGIAVDGSGNAYITGYTDSNNFPTTGGSFRTSFSGGNDAFVTKLNATGSGLIYSTFIGGSSDDFGQGIAVDGSGKAYVTGFTLSTDFPTTGGAYRINSGGGYDAFVTKVNVVGSNLVYSTYLGGNDSDEGYGIAVDDSENAYVTGYTASSNFPTRNATQPTSGGNVDAFVTALAPTGQVAYSTYVGGGNDDTARGIAVDSKHNTYVTGYTMSANFPTLNAQQGNSAGSLDAFVTKYRVPPRSPYVLSIDATQPANLTTNANTVTYTVAFSETVTGVDAADFRLAMTGTLATAPIQVTPVGGSAYTVTVTGITGSGSLGLNLIDDNSIRDSDGNVLTQQSSAPAFRNQMTFATGIKPSALTAADMNGDGRADLLVANLGNDSVSLLLGNGNGTFALPTTLAMGSSPFSIGSSPYSLVAADVNGDGRLDLLVANRASDSVNVLLGNGNGTFALPSTLAMGLSPFSVATADVNEDSRPDIVVANFLNGVSVLLGNGNGTFASQATYYFTGGYPRSVAVADLNSDGQLDLVVPVIRGVYGGLDGNVVYSDYVSVLLGNGNGTFQNQTTFDINSYWVFNAEVTDVNSDGKLDLLIAGYSSNNVSVLLGNGNGTFYEAPAVPTTKPRTLVSADFDGDGILDFALTNDGVNTLSVFQGNGNGDFHTAPAIATGASPVAVAAQDLDGDGRIDLVVANTDDNTIGVFLNAINGNFTGPVYTIDQTPPVVAAITDANSNNLSAGIVTPGMTALQVQFTKPVLGADQASNYQLQIGGPDGRLGTVDDVLVPQTVSYSGTSATLGFASLGASPFRLAIKDTIADALGNHLDGDGNGTAGGNYVRDFLFKTTTVLTANGPSFSPVGQSVTYTVAVTSGAGAISGQTVSIQDGSNGNAVLATPTLNNGRASFDIRFDGSSAALGVGSHYLFAVYAGDAGNAPSLSSQISHTVANFAGSVHAAVLDGVLRVQGDSFDNKIELRQADQSVHVYGAGQLVGSFPVAAISGINVLAGFGNDFVDLAFDPSAVVSLPATLMGEEGYDQLKGGTGDDRLDGGMGFNVLDGGQGTNTLFDQGKAVLRPTLLVVVHGFELYRGEAIGTGAETGKGAWAENGKEVADKLEQAGSQTKTWLIDWNSTVGSNTDATQRVADAITEFVSGQNQIWDVFFLGHSRGGIFVKDVGNKLRDDSHFGTIRQILLDPTAADLMHDKSGAVSSRVKATVYDDEHVLVPFGVTDGTTVINGADYIDVYDGKGNMRDNPTQALADYQAVTGSVDAVNSALKYGPVVANAMFGVMLADESSFLVPLLIAAADAGVYHMEITPWYLHKSDFYRQDISQFITDKPSANSTKTRSAADNEWQQGKRYDIINAGPAKFDQDWQDVLAATLNYVRYFPDVLFSAHQATADGVIKLLRVLTLKQSSDDANVIKAKNDFAHVLNVAQEISDSVFTLVRSVSNTAFARLNDLVRVGVEALLKQLEDASRNHGSSFAQVTADFDKKLIAVFKDALTDFLRRFSALFLGTVNVNIDTNGVSFDASVSLPHFRDAFTAHVTFTSNGRLTIDGEAKLPMLGTAQLKGTVAKSGSFSLVASNVRNPNLGVSWSNLTVTVSNGGLAVSGTASLPMLGSVILSGTITSSTAFSLTGRTEPKSIGEFKFPRLEVAFSNRGLEVKGTWSLPPLGDVFLQGKIKSGTEFSLSGSTKPMSLGVFTIPSLAVTFTNRELKVTGKMELPLLGEVTLESTITSSTAFILTGSFKPKKINGVTFPKLTVTLSNSGLTVSGTWSMPILGNVTLEGPITSSKAFSFSTASFKPPLIKGIKFPSLTVTLSNTGLKVKGTAELPLLGDVELEGTITSSTEFSLTKTFTPKPFKGLTFPSLMVTLSNNGLEVLGRADVPLLGDVDLKGKIQSSTKFSLKGSIKNKDIKGFPFGNLEVNISNDGIGVLGKFVLPLVNEMTLTGKITDAAHFNLSVSNEQRKINGFIFSGLTVTVSESGLKISGQANLVVLGRVDVSSFVQSDGRYSLSLTLKKALQLGRAGSSISTDTSFKLGTNGITFDGEIRIAEIGFVKIRGTVYSDGTFDIDGIPGGFLNFTVAELARLWHGLGVAWADIARTMNIALGFADHAVSDFLKSAGAGANELKGALKSAFNWGEAQVSNFLGQAGGVVSSVGNTLSSIDWSGGGGWGLLQGSTVFFDADKNGVLDAGEPWGFSDSQGQVRAAVPLTYDINGNGVLDDNEGQWIIVGGVDLMTGVTQVCQLVAPASWSVVTPLSTFVSLLTTNYGLTTAAAKAQVLQAMNLQPQLDLSTFDPIAQTLAGNPAGPLVEGMHARIYGTITQVAALFRAPYNSQPSTDLTNSIEVALAGLIAQATSPINFGDQATILSLVRMVEVSRGVVLDNDLAAKASGVIAGANRQIDGISPSTDLRYLVDVAKVKIVSQGSVADDLAAAAAGLRSIDSVVANDTGAPLAAKIAATPTPPIVTLPLNITSEATGPNGAAVTFAVGAFDLAGQPLTPISSVASGSTFPFGVTTVTVSATDSLENTASGSFSVTVLDTAPPVLSTPADQTVEATTRGGALVMLANVIATDLVDPNPTLTYDHPSGFFPMGMTLVTATATDASGNTSSTSFTVTVVDTKAPSLSLPANLIVEANVQGGAIVTLPEATAIDLVDANPLVAADQTSGFFALGTTTVNITSTDASGNSSSGSFTVTVIGTTPPTLYLPENIIVEANAPGGAMVTLPEATATDFADADPLVTTDHPSGFFPMGTTIVNVTATGAFGNTSRGGFSVTVADTTPPVLSMPADRIVLASEPGGATVTLPQATATDLADANPSVSMDSLNGLFPLGSTLVTATATDASGNSSSDTFSVIVVDGAGAGALIPVITRMSPFRVENTLIAVKSSTISRDTGNTVTGITYSWVVYKDEATASFAESSGTDETAFSFTPNDNGIYQIQLTVNDSQGNTATTDETIQIFNLPHQVQIGNLPATSVEGTTINVTALVQDPSLLDTQAGFTYTWKVTKDGAPFATLSDQTGGFSFTPDDNGSYKILLMATDKDGASTSVEQSVTVTNVAPTLSSLAAVPTNTRGMTTLTGTITDPGAQDSFTLTVNWGDPLSPNNIETYTFGANATGSQPIALTHVYANHDPGSRASQSYNIHVTVTDDDAEVGNADTMTRADFSGPQGPPASRRLAVVSGANSSGGPDINVFDAATHQLLFSVVPYDPQFTGGVRVAVGDVNGDSISDIITAAGPGGGPDVAVFSGKDGTRLFSFFAFDPQFTGGVVVASGDINGDGFADVIVGAGAGGGPQVKIFSGQDSSLLHSFFAFDMNFTGGVQLAVGDVNGDGVDDLVVAAGPGGGPDVKVFDGKTREIVRSFFAYDQDFTGGVYLALADVNSDGKQDIITGAGPGGGPQVRVFNGEDAALLQAYFAYDAATTSGVMVAGIDLDNDGRPDLVTGQPSDGANLRAFDTLSGLRIDEFFTNNPLFNSSIFEGAIH